MTLSLRRMGIPFAGLITGFVAGLLPGMVRPREEMPPSGKNPARDRLLRTAHVPPSTVRLTLQELSILQKGEIERLEVEVARLSAVSGKGMSRQQKLDFARQVCETYAAEYEADMHPERKHELKRMLYEIDEEMAPYFIDRYRSDPDPTIRWVSWYLAIAAGGPAAAEFLNSWLQDPATPADRRAGLLESLCGFDEIIPFSFKKIPVAESLGTTAVRFSESASPGDRMGAAALLGNSEAPGSEAVLRRMAGSDPDQKVRGVAIRSLGRIGTRETLAYLRNCPSPASNVGYPDPTWYVKAALAESINELQLRFSD